MWIKFKEQDKYHFYENGGAVCDYVGTSQTEEAIVLEVECRNKCKDCYASWMKQRTDEQNEKFLRPT